MERMPIVKRLVLFYKFCVAWWRMQRTFLPSKCTCNCGFKVRAIFTWASKVICDWFRKLMPLSQPITNRDLVACVFPHFRQLVVFTWNSHWLSNVVSFLWLTVVVTLVLVLRNSIKKALFCWLKVIWSYYFTSLCDWFRDASALFIVAEFPIAQTTLSPFSLGQVCLQSKFCQPCCLRDWPVQIPNCSLIRVNIL